MILNEGGVSKGVANFLKRGEREKDLQLLIIVSSTSIIILNEGKLFPNVWK